MLKVSLRSTTRTALSRSNSAGEQAVVNGQALSRDVQVDAGSNVTLLSLTMTGGSTAGSGGGILNNGTLTLVGVSAGGDHAAGAGGGLDNQGVVNIAMSTFNGDSAAVGGGIFDAGSVTIANSLIEGNVEGGIVMTSSGNIVVSNLIRGNEGPGVMIAGGANNTIGTLYAPNTIAYNSGAGVGVVGADAVGNSIRGNSIYLNGNLGINFGGGWPLANHVGIVTSGPNLLQNAPEIASFTNGGTTNVQGSLSANPNSTYTVDFYANDVIDANYYGEGQEWIGAIQVTTDGAGNASFNANLTTPTAFGAIVTSTATDMNGNTSEFSFVSPQLQIDSLKQIVAGLYDGGVFNFGRANAFDAKLNAALASLNHGQAFVAVHQLGAFEHQTLAFLLNGILPQRAGFDLYDGAQNLINRLDGFVSDGPIQLLGNSGLVGIGSIEIGGGSSGDQGNQGNSGGNHGHGRG